MKHRQRSMVNTTTGKNLLIARQDHFFTLTVLILTLPGFLFLGCEEKGLTIKNCDFNDIDPNRAIKIEGGEPKIIIQVILIWPEVITNPDYEYTGEYIRERAIADGLAAWGCCSMELRPKNFGKGMLKIGKILDCVATSEKLMELSKDLQHRE